MSNVYETNYGVTFNGHHSYTYYHLLPTSAPTIAPPEVKTFYVEVPGADGSLDLTEVLTGYPTYGDRKGSFEFLINAPRAEWYTIYNQIVHDLNGKQADVILDEDYEYFYKGRLTVAAPNFGKHKGVVKVTGVFASERYVNNAYSGNDWLWNPFDFENGIAREYYQMPIMGVKTIHLISSDLTTCPKFTLHSGYIEMWIGEKHYVLREGDNIFLDVLLQQNTTLDVVLSGNGVVTITYRIGGNA